MISSFIRKTTTFINIEYLREMAYSIHQIESINLDRLLWITYLHSGTGELKPKGQIRTSSSNFKISLWADEVKSKIIAHDPTKTIDSKDIDQDSYVAYVNRVLEKFQNQLVYYESQLEQQKQKLNNSLTSEIEEAIRKFVQQNGIALYKISIDGLIATVEYDYKDQLIRLEFEKENPNEFQVSPIIRLRIFDWFVLLLCI